MVCPPQSPSETFERKMLQSTPPTVPRTIVYNRLQSFTFVYNSKNSKKNEKIQKISQKMRKIRKIPSSATLRNLTKLSDTLCILRACGGETGPGRWLRWWWCCWLGKEHLLHLHTTGQITYLLDLRQKRFFVVQSCNCHPARSIGTLGDQCVENPNMLRFQKIVYLQSADPWQLMPTKFA